MREQLVVMGEEKEGMWGYFPGGSAAETLSSQCMRPELDPWSGNYILHAAGKTWSSRIK